MNLVSLVLDCFVSRSGDSAELKSAEVLYRVLWLVPKSSISCSWKFGRLLCKASFGLAVTGGLRVVVVVVVARVVVVGRVVVVARVVVVVLVIMGILGLADWALGSSICGS